MLVGLAWVGCCARILGCVTIFPLLFFMCFVYFCLNVNCRHLKFHGRGSCAELSRTKKRARMRAPWGRGSKQMIKYASACACFLCANVCVCVVFVRVELSLCGMRFSLCGFLVFLFIHLDLQKGRSDGRVFKWTNLSKVYICSIYRDIFKYYLLRWLQ